MKLDLTGRRALVTGGGQGVGRGIAMGLASAGADIVVNDLHEVRATSVVDEIREHGGTASARAFDVTDYLAVTSAVDGLAGVDILVNNVGNAGADGFGGRGKFVDSEPADWDPFLQANLYSVMYCTRAVLPGMVAKGWGRVITIVSDAGRTGAMDMAAYAAAKAGSAGLTRALAMEVGRHGVTVNNIALGTMRTPATEAMWADADNPTAKSIMQNYIVRRPGVPDDVAALAVLLASPEASWITGQTYPVNGGFSFAL